MAVLHTGKSKEEAPHFWVFLVRSMVANMKVTLLCMIDGLMLTDVFCLKSVLNMKSKKT